MFNNLVRNCSKIGAKVQYSTARRRSSWRPRRTYYAQTRVLSAPGYACYT
jgi:hypothetical protein